MTTTPTPEDNDSVAREHREPATPPAAATPAGEAALLDDATGAATGPAPDAPALPPVPDATEVTEVAEVTEIDTVVASPASGGPEGRTQDVASSDAPVSDRPSTGTSGSAAETPEHRDEGDASDVPWDVARLPGAVTEGSPVAVTAPPSRPTEAEPADGVAAEVGGRSTAGAAATTAASATGASWSADAPPPAPDHHHGRHEAPETAPAAPASTNGAPAGGWSKLGRAMRPQVTRSQLLAGLLCALLGFALAVQVSQTQEQQLSSLRQSDLVRLLDDVTQRANALETRVEGLQETRDELSSGSGQQRAALELAQRQSETQGILSGRLPAEGPGITLTITETDQRIPAHKLFNILEELRNAGVEVVEVNGIRLVTSSYFEETSRGMVVDGQKVSSPYRWKAIGDPSTLETALEIPGGAMASVRNEGADPKITQEDLITITSTREPEAPEFATPVPAEGGN
ncbi:DUF881 domain-containing protein [Oerskovia jenensis]|uniref:Uncharacterized protein YlxW (UPF0749 family) n=1 Tax=Oerskovia jenensis TaxID=162169 RepID=A0ABS2LA92_9CELL|nr:DUF881 domain-containing protein [Oerskovia jenensis]MBM7477330.1 uncharacterized protein YlxW (UPF0749 family) [Oerskovia jenensis]